jgi:4-carboxymuconolactone decarboxylase
MANPTLHRLGGAIIFCLDWERCCAFYQKTLELFLVDRKDDHGHATFQLAGSPLTLERVSAQAAAERGLVGRFTGVCFETDDIAAAHRALSDAGARFREAPHPLPSGAWTADFADPDGNVLSLRQPAPAVRPPEQQAAFETIRDAGRGATGGPFLAWGQHPCLPRLVDAMGAYFLRQGTLPPRLRELAIITIGRIWTAQIEWYAHVPAARRHGISADVVDAIANRRPPDFPREDEALVHRFATELSETRSVSDGTFAALVRELGVPASVELVALLGFYTMTAMALKTFRLNPPADATRLLPE